MEKSISSIFGEHPEQWGLRGDLYMWEDLKNRFSRQYLPYLKDNFISDIYNIFREVAGEELGSQEMTYVRQYDHGGISGGYLSHIFWIETALPLLLLRLERCDLPDEKL